MPIRNEADFIGRSLEAIISQDYPHTYMEVLIADGMSEDNTRHIIQQLAHKTDIPVTILDNPKRIVSTGFNLALQKARGDIIVRIDGHCEIKPDYVTQCVFHLGKPELGGVGGPIETVSQNAVGEAIATAMSSTFGVGGSDFRTKKDKQMFTDTIAFPAYRRDVFRVAGTLDEELVRNQDDEYNYRLRSLGYKLLLTPDVKSLYYSRSSILKLWKQYYDYGLFKVRVMQKHPGQMRPRHFAPALLVSSVLAGLLLSPFNRSIQRLWLITVGLYSSANSVASVITAYRAGWRQLPLLPIVFATLHFGYGLGFLCGLVKFRSRWHNP
jgi:glycosyltransferase involved in cell wall biosynthesis